METVHRAADAGMGVSKDKSRAVGDVFLLGAGFSRAISDEMPLLQDLKAAENFHRVLSQRSCTSDDLPAAPGASIISWSRCPNNYITAETPIAAAAVPASGYTAPIFVGP